MKLGVLGFAHGHVNSYCREWRAHPELGVEVTAGWDGDAERAARAGKQHGVEIFEAPEALLENAGVEAVVVAAETSLHADLVEKAAAAGRGVVLQKPMALTLDEADRIVAAVERHGVPFAMAWQMRVDRQNVVMREMVRSGELGKLFMVRRRHGLATQNFPNFENSWHVKAELNRDIWADDAAHPIDFVYWLLGEPGSVTAELSTLLNPKVPNDNGVAVFRYEDGLLAEVCCSFVCLAHEPTTEIVGEKGVLIQNYGDGPSSNCERPPEGIELKWFSAESGRWTVLDVPGYAKQGDRIAGLAAPLAEFLNGGGEPIATAAEGRDVLRMTLACYRSSDEGRRIPLALSGTQEG
ncbi:MAG: Gfo/Idh/MocA family protein [Planctomycetota bacterium]|jgi:predicted dehydrogenase